MVKGKFDALDAKKHEPTGGMTAGVVKVDAAVAVESSTTFVGIVVALEKSVLCNK